MTTCWLCGVGITKINAAGKRGNSLTSICKSCNTIQSLVYSLMKLSDKELESKIASVNTRLGVHRVVRDNKGLSAGDLTRLAVIGRSKL